MAECLENDVRKKKMTLEVLGTTIHLVTDRSEEYVRSLADSVEERAKKLMLTGKGCSKEVALLLCAMNDLDGKLTAEAELTACKNELTMIRGID